MNPAHLFVNGEELRHRMHYGEKASLSAGGNYAGTLTIFRYGDHLYPADLARQTEAAPIRLGRYSPGYRLSALLLMSASSAVYRYAGFRVRMTRQLL